MEIELKYRLENEDIAKQVEEVTLNSDYTVESSDQQLDMKAVYFDTEDGLLQKNLIAFRIRKEGTRNIATLKWGGKQEGSLHVREELNISVGSGEIPASPDIDVFSQSEIGEKMIQIIGHKKLIPIMNIDIKRHQWQAEDENTVVEFCFDDGEIKVGSQIEKIREMEIELITGDENKLLILGDRLSEKYGLQPEKRSKYERGLALLNKINT